MGWLTTLQCMLLLACYTYGEQTTEIATFHTCKDRKMNYSSIIEVADTTDGIECARLCKRNENCKSTNFIRGKNICQLMRDNAECEQLPVDEDSDVFRMIRRTCPYNAAVNPCKFNQPFNETSCQCLCGQGFSGVKCENPPRDCTDLDTNGHADIYLPDTNEIQTVRCNKVFQMFILEFRDNTALSSHGLDGWSEFKLGFNSYGFQDFWIGNDVVNKITTTEHSYILETSIKYNATKKYQSKYYEFVMDNEANNYTLHFASCWKSAGHDGAFSNNTQFHAVDYNSNNCTNTHGSSWWYNEMCLYPSPFTGNYPMSGTVNPIAWWNMYLRRM